jgi:hypothetical protein
MKAWLKGGLIGVCISLVIQIAYVIYYATTCSGEGCMGLIIFAPFIGILYALGILLIGLLIGFIIGVSVGLIIDLLGVKHLFFAVLVGCIFNLLYYTLSLSNADILFFISIPIKFILIPFRKIIEHFLFIANIILFFAGYLIYVAIIFIINKIKSRNK